MNFLKDKHPGNFCMLGFELNGLVDKGEYLSFEDLYKMAEEETLIDWLEKKCQRDFHWDSDDKKIMSAEFFSLVNATDAERNFRITNNGISLLVAYCFKFIQNPPSRTIEDI